VLRHELLERGVIKHIGPLRLQPLDQRLPDLFQRRVGATRVIDGEYSDMQMLFLGGVGQFSVSGTRACCQNKETGSNSNKKTPSI
jgi:hypothetical protein